MVSRPVASTSPLYPDVPIVAGVPSVFRGPNNPAGAATTPPAPLTQDSAAAVPDKPKWGIYASDGTLALDVDSVVAIEPRREFRISDYPVELGGFANYNKVATPEELRFTVTKGGSDADRTAFLNTLKSIIETTDLFNIVTPDTAFTGYNVVSYDYQRSADRGATLLTVELHCVEVRQSAQTKYSDSKAPAGADLKNDGPVQPVAPTVTQTPLVGPR